MVKGEWRNGKISFSEKGSGRIIRVGGLQETFFEIWKIHKQGY